MARRIYAAYGSNLSVSQMAYRCPDAKIVGKGKIQDYKLVFRLHADIELHKGSYVPVLVWSISEADEKRLDKYEGVKSGHYHQEDVKVIMGDGEMNAMVYIMNSQDTVFPPQTEYYKIIDDGYRRFGFDKEILKNAMRECVQKTANNGC